MKKISIALISLCTFCVMQSCNSDSTKTDSTATTTDSSTNSTNQGSDSSNRVGMSDTSGANHMADTATSKMTMQKPDKESTDFMMKAASGSMMEVALGQVAQDKAKSQRVKDFGSMLVTDHTKALGELKTIASSKNIMVPSSMMPEHQKHVDMLKMKSGADFDKAYMNMMLDDHKKDIADFKKATKSADADVKDFASKTLPVLEKHLDSAQAIHSSKM